MARGKKEQELVFGLDIGTRSIVGTVGYREGTAFHVVAQYIKEHETRAMLDGQIHDIPKVSATICQVKEELEKRIDRKLKTVCIAAAGRVLRTVTTNVVHTYTSEREVTEEDIYALETMGVEKAFEEFTAANDTDMQFYCVGYTAIRYYLNGYTIINLAGHKAKNIGVDLIATFLPDDVVDGLYKAVNGAGLQVANLTLEPIAAIQVAIPEKFRLLNLALVDVGAGTSDISITKEGTITAYGMIPVAGDSLTDLIVQQCLVEFDTAEYIKRTIATQEVVEYEDILGLPQRITREEVKNLLQPAIESMTKEVAECIRELNGEKPVSAVFVVGGGGVVAGYTETLAKELGLAKERVAIRGKEVMQNIQFENEGAQKDSMMVTPIGICLSYYEQNNNFIFVQFNEEQVKLYDNGKLMVVDAAIAAGFPNEDLFPKRGKSLVYTVDGKNKMQRGLPGEAAVITVNGKESDIHSKIVNGDKIVVTPSTAGEDGKVKLDKLSQLHEKVKIIVNGNEILLDKSVKVNGNNMLSSYEIQDNDVIEVIGYYTVEQIAQLADVILDETMTILVNDVPAKPDTKVYHDFSVSFVKNTTSSEAQTFEEYVQMSENEVNTAEADTVQMPEETIVEAKVEQTVSVVNEQKEEELPQNIQTQDDVTVVLVNKQPVVMRGKSEYIFVDVFDYIQFDLRESGGRNIVTLLNGRQAQYMETIKEGDIIDIYWEN
ncbi:MAG: rod shape-determining protein [Lachnospiraceae bacterium]|nr:rod shape-determining protein [Lachnospiraceae bacterium]